MADVAYNTSVRGSYVNFTATAAAGNVKSKSLIIDDFPGDGDPLRIDNAEFGSLEIDINGVPFRRATLKPFTVTLSMIPGTYEEQELNGLAMQNLGYPFHSVKIAYHSGRTDHLYDKTFSDGIFKSVQAGYPVGRNGRVPSMQYVFEFPPMIEQNISTDNAIDNTSNLTTPSFSETGGIAIA